ncbi:hypothetical protein TgHK011_008467 [Trichoderma gracile]|nr:hypothetical protein TgHK011_008467 [Trichoderma gracile]
MGEYLRPAHWAPPNMTPSGGARVVQKRSSDEMDAAGEMEPAYKRPALAERLEAAVARQDVAMSEAAAGAESPGICPHIQKRPWRQEDAKAEVEWPLLPDFFQSQSMQEYLQRRNTQDTDGSYWYHRWPTQLGHPPPCTLHEIPIQDMKLIPGKTFFYIDEMINSIKEQVGVGWGQREHGVFELFAGIAHTGCGDGRGWHTRYQSFQLEDLFGGPPYITGFKAFTYYDYDESTEFLRATKTDDKCYCLCEVVQDFRSELGWSLYIHEIQPVSWETMRCAHASMGRMTDDGVVERQTKMCVGEDFW